MSPSSDVLSSLEGVFLTVVRRCPSVVGTAQRRDGREPSVDEQAPPEREERCRRREDRCTRREGGCTRLEEGWVVTGFEGASK
jgi:hypothetical protein